MLGNWEVLWLSPSAAKAAKTVEPQMNLPASRWKERGLDKKARVPVRRREVECAPTSWGRQKEGKRMSQERAEEARRWVRETPSEEREEGNW